MELYFSVIADALRDRGLTVNTNTGLETELPLKDVRLWDGIQAGTADYLYIITADQLAKSPEDCLPQNLVLLSPKTEELPASPHQSMRIVCAQPAFTVFSWIQEIFAAYREWYARILEAVIENRDVREILEIISEKLKNPIALLDTSTTLIHWAGTFKSSYENSIWEDVLDKGYSCSYHTRNEEKKLLENMRKTPLPYIHRSSKNEHCSMMSCELFHQGKAIASIGLTDVNSPFTDGEIRLVNQIRKPLEAACGKRALAMENVPVFLKCLLLGQEVDFQKLSSYLHRFSWKPEGSFRLLCFTEPALTESSRSASGIYLRRLEEKFPGALLCSHEDHIIVILNTPGDLRNDPDFLEKALLLYSEFQLQCGVSMEFLHFRDLRLYYQQALGALKEGMKAAPKNPPYFYSNYYQAYLFRMLEASVDPKVLCHPKLLDMWRNPDENQQILLHTLYIYLLCGKNSTETASLLHIHRTTLTYRLEKLSDILEVDFRKLNEETHGLLLMSCLILNQLPR